MLIEIRKKNKQTTVSNVFTYQFHWCNGEY